MRAGCFAETRVIELLNRRFVPFFFNRGGPGKGHDEAARKFTVGKTRNQYAYLAAFTPEGKILGETHVYADKDAVFEWLQELLNDHPRYASYTASETALMLSSDGEKLEAKAKMLEELGQYDEAIAAYEELLGNEKRRKPALVALLRIARYQKDWKRHEDLESTLRSGDPNLDADVELGYRLIAREDYKAARSLLQPLTKAPRAIASPRLAEAHFYAGVACWFDKDRDWAKFHWCWIVDNLPGDRMYMRARVAAAAEIMPYPNPELGNYKARGMIGTGHIVREVAKSMRIYERLKPDYARLGAGSDGPRAGAGKESDEGKGP